MPTYGVADVSQSRVAGVSFVHKYGLNPDVDAGDTEVVSDDSAAAHNWQTSNQSVEVVSSSVGDTDTTGAGAQTLTVIGQNLAGTEQTETVGMDGTNAVALSNTYTIIYRAFVATCGATGTNAGNITIRIAGAGATLAKILTGNGQTLMAVYRIPVSSSGLLHGWGGGVAGNTTAVVTLKLRARYNGGADRVKDVLVSSTTGSCFVAKRYEEPILYDALTELYVTATSSAANAAVSAFMDITVDGG